MAWTLSDVPPQTGRSAVITGPGGIGFEATLALAKSGAEVILAGRNPDKGAEALRRIQAAAPSGTVKFELLDLASLASIAAFADRLRSERSSLDMLVNNAGVMAPPDRQTTADGFERQLGVNHLGHFALTGRLLPLLLEAPAPRVVAVSSIAHRRGAIDFDDLQSITRYNPFKAYSQSKLADLMFALELDRRAKAAGTRLLGVAAHPGVAATELIANGMKPNAFVTFATSLVMPLIGQSAAAGALPILFAATSPTVKGGDYYGSVGGKAEMRGPPGPARIAPQALDEAVAKRLWEVSETLTGVSIGI